MSYDLFLKKINSKEVIFGVVGSGYVGLLLVKELTKKSLKLLVLI
jgi:UDP-N-acetyl-D-mannosaminuronate dehydrogenase